MESENFTKAKKMVKALEVDIDAARRAWAVFLAGNGSSETQRAPLRTAMEKTLAAYTFINLMVICQNETVMALARLTDSNSGDRNSLGTLNNLIAPIQEEIVEAASHWHDGRSVRFYNDNIDASSQTIIAEQEISELNENSKQDVAEGLTKLILDIPNFLRSDEIGRVRNLRNVALAHTLSIDTIYPRIDDIGTAFQTSSTIVSQASYLLNGAGWEPEDFNEVTMKHANAFWDAFEKGLTAQDQT